MRRRVGNRLARDAGQSPAPRAGDAQGGACAGASPEDADPDEWEAPAEEEEGRVRAARREAAHRHLAAIEDDAAGAREKEAKAKAQSDGAEKELGTPQSETDAEAIETPEPRETDETDETEYVYERAEDAAAHRALLETLLPPARVEHGVQPARADRDG